MLPQPPPALALVAAPPAQHAQCPLVVTPDPVYPSVLVRVQVQAGCTETEYIRKRSTVNPHLVLPANSCCWAVTPRSGWNVWAKSWVIEQLDWRTDTWKTIYPKGGAVSP